MKLKIIKVGQTSGAIVIPKDIRRVFGYGIGSEFKADFSKNRVILIKLKTVKQKPKVPEPIMDSSDEPIMLDENDEPIIIPRKRKIPVEEPFEITCPICKEIFYDEDCYDDHILHCPAIEPVE